MAQNLNIDELKQKKKFCKKSWQNFCGESPACKEYDRRELQGWNSRRVKLKRKKNFRAEKQNSRLLNFL